MINNYSRIPDANQINPSTVWVITHALTHHTTSSQGLKKQQDHVCLEEHLLTQPGHNCPQELFVFLKMVFLERFEQFL